MKEKKDDHEEGGAGGRVSSDVGNALNLRRDFITSTTIPLLPGLSSWTRMVCEDEDEKNEYDKYKSGGKGCEMR